MIVGAFFFGLKQRTRLALPASGADEVPVGDFPIRC